MPGGSPRSSGSKPISTRSACAARSISTPTTSEEFAMKKIYIVWALSAYIAFVFVQSLFFKFTGSEESIFIFSTLRDWSGIGLFEPAGRWIIGFAELVASILLFVPRRR